MKTEIKKINKRNETIEADQFPKGTFRGIWSGYEVRLDINGDTYRLDTEEGIRGMSRVEIISNEIGVTIKTL